jgi:hypothetical protein
MRIYHAYLYVFCAVTRTRSVNGVSLQARLLHFSGLRQFGLVLARKNGDTCDRYFVHPTMKPQPALIAADIPVLPS